MSWPCTICKQTLPIPVSQQDASGARAALHTASITRTRALRHATAAQQPQQNLLCTELEASVPQLATFKSFVELISSPENSV